MKLILMAAQTVDGIIAKNPNQNADWTSPADKKSFVAETKKHGAIIFGRTTFEAIGRALPGRLNLILTSEPEKYQDQTRPGQLEFFNGQPTEVVQMLKKRGFKSAVLGGGSRTNAAFLRASLVDEILITIEPKIFGRGLNFTEGQEFDLNLKLLETKKIGEDAIQLHYQVIK